MVKCGSIVMTPVNGRTVRLTGDLTKCKREVKESRTVSLTYSDDECTWKLEPGSQIFPRPKSPYKVNFITPGRVDGRIVSYELMVAEQTLASIFVMPFLGGNRRQFMWDTLFVNAFVAAGDHNDCICLLYRYSGEALFLKFESALCSFRNFRARFDPDPYHVMFVFDIPEHTRYSYDAFIAGRYSEIDDLWKLKILEFHDFDIDGQTGKILFQSESLRRQLEEKLDVMIPPDSELHDRPNFDKEIFDEEVYKVKASKLK
mgnify:FL=1